MSNPDSGKSKKLRALNNAGFRRSLTLEDQRPSLRLGHTLGASHNSLSYPLQAKLTVNQPGDQYEQEADRVAEQVMHMPYQALHLQREPAAREAPAIAPPVVTNVLRSPGQPLNSTTRALMESRFGHDFSHVRVHICGRGAESARSINARAYTVGRDIVFGANEYGPETSTGRNLLAHELVHVVQQGSSAPLNSSSAAQAELERGVPDTISLAPGGGSSALAIRRRLSESLLTHATIQRAPSSWAGEYTTDKYEVLKNAGQDGVDIELKFKPNKHVDAELIGMTQSARSSLKTGPVPASTFYSTAAEKKAFEDFRIPVGEAAAGTMIDRVVSYGNPLYATDKPSAGDTLSSTATVAFWGEHGWHYTDKAGKLKEHDALLKDGPWLPTALKGSSQVFETTALAVKGVQEGTYYGSVQWGWERNAAGKVEKLPLTLVSNDVPSSTFARAAGIWNQAKTSEGIETIDLPIVTGKYTNTRGVWLVSNPSLYKSTIIGKLAKNTRLEATDKGAGQRFNRTIDKYKWWKATIVDGTHIGKVGWVMQTLLSDTQT